MTALHEYTVLVYRAPVKGAPRRFSRAAAFRDWARAIVREAPCRMGECGGPLPGYGDGPDNQPEWCDRHDPTRRSALVTRVQRMLMGHR